MTNKLLQALELDKNNNWNAAHKIVQEINHPLAFWIHAYLHRKEGDSGNASFWYSSASRSFPNYSLEQEWKEIHDEIKGNSESQL